ncbi:hypothetical protein GCM10028808_14740 [Spirosoma migulaei]
MFLFVHFAHAQVFPLQIQVSVMPPYSAYLQDYPGAGQQVRVFIINTGRQSYQVRLSGQLTGDNGIEIRTSPNYRPPRPLTVPPGQTLLSRNDLEGLFDLNQIEVTGIDKNLLSRGFPLPDGTYQLCVRAYNETPTNTVAVAFGQPLSPEFPLGCSAPIVVRAVEPPILIAPLCDADITATTPQALVFTWTPPAGVSPAQVDYTLRVVELPQVDVDPNVFIDAVALPKSGVEVRNLRTSTFLYGPTQPPLQVGRRYAWRVQAVDRSGKLNFLNDGKSPVCSFTYGIVPKELVKPGLELVQTPTKILPIPGLGNQVANIPADSAKPIAVAPKPLKAAKAKIVCHAVDLPSDANPLTGVLKDKTVKLGEFDLTIATATSTNGGYDGDGRVSWNGIPIKVSFTGLKVNGQNQVFDGVVSSSNSQPSLPNITLDGSLPDNYLDKITTSITDFAKQTATVPLPLKYEGKLGTIGISQMNFSPVGAEMDMVLGVALPEAAGKNLFLAAVNVCTSPQKKLPDTGTLYLIKDYQLPLVGQTFVFKQSDPSSSSPTGTYANIVKGDFEKVHAVMELNLGSKLLKLDDGKGGTKAGDVKATLTADFEKWADWVATVSLPAFQVPGATGVTFTGVDVAYDHSDKTNPDGFSVPNEYPGEKGPTWHGIFFKKLNVELPPSLKNDPRIGVSVSNGIVDGSGFTGFITPVNKPILDYTKGSLGGFGFSIEDMDVLLVASKYIRGGFGGKLQCPISSDPLTYTCTMQGVFDELQFTALPMPGDFHVPLFAANLTLNQNTAITVTYKANQKTILNVSLSGHAEINTSFLKGGVKSAVDATLPKLYFEKFSVANDVKFGGTEIGGVGIYLNTGDWSLTNDIAKSSPSGPSKGGQGHGPYSLDEELEFYEPMADTPNGSAAGFPIYFDTPKMVNTPDGAGVQLAIGIKLGGEDKTLVDGKGTFDVLGTISKGAGGRFTPSFNGVFIRRITLKGELGPVSVDGSVNFFNKDTKFGSGFKGNASVNIPSIGSGIDVVVLFGKTSTYHYFYLDANARFSPGIPMVGPLMLTGLGGGVLYNLAIDKLPANGPSEGAKTGEADMKNIGATPSGVVYTPKQGGWGIKARVFAGLVDTHVFNSSVELSATFENGGMTYMGMTGLGVVLSPTGLPTKQDGVVNSNVTIAWSKGVAPAGDAFDVTASVNGSFLSSSISIPVGMHFSSSTWHVKLGDPYGAFDGSDGKRIKATLLNINESVVKVNLTLTGYAAVGNDMHTLPALPTDVSNFFASHPDKGDPAQGNQQAVANMEQQNKKYEVSGSKVPTGGDFALMLGGALDGNLTVQCMPFRLKAKGIVGFDAALFKDQTCKEGNKPAGIMGWYGTGQVYAYFMGAIDLFVDVWFFEGAVELMKLQAGAQLAGGFPSPSWAEGDVAVSGEVLDGLISVDTDAHFQFGDKCQPVYSGDPLSDIKVISDMQPGNGAKDVDCRPTLAVAFNMPMNKPFVIHIPNGDSSPGGTPRIYIFQPQAPVLTYSTAQKKNVPVTKLSAQNWSADKKSYTIQATDYLPSLATCAFTQTVVVKEQVNYKLLDPYIDKLQARVPRTQDSTLTFTLGQQPNEIPAKDLQMTWPIDKQVYFLKNQLKKGFIRGNYGGLDILKDTQNPAFQYVMVFQEFDFVQGMGKSVEQPISYNGNGLITFDIPSTLKNAQAYFMTLRKRTKTTGSGANGSLTQVSYASLSKNGGVQYQRTSVNTSALQNVAAISTEGQKLLGFVFITSRYNTIAEKLKGLRLRASDYNVAYQLQLNPTVTDGYEGFDSFELVGGSIYPNAQIEPMLSERAPKVDTPFEQTMQKNLYDVMQTLSINDKTETTTNYNTWTQQSTSDGGGVVNSPSNPVTTSHYTPATIQQTDVLWSFFRDTYTTNEGAPIYLGPNDRAVLHSGPSEKFALTYYRDQIMQNDLGAMVNLFWQMRVANSEAAMKYAKYLKQKGKIPGNTTVEAYAKEYSTKPAPYPDCYDYWQNVTAQTPFLSLKSAVDLCSFPGSIAQQNALKPFFDKTQWDYDQVPVRKAVDPFNVEFTYRIQGESLFTPGTYTQAFHIGDVNTADTPKTKPVQGAIQPGKSVQSLESVLKNSVPKNL